MYIPRAAERTVLDLLKEAATVRPDDARYFPLLDDFKDYEPGPGAVISQTSRPLPITRDVTALPVWCI